MNKLPMANIAHSRIGRYASVILQVTLALLIFSIAYLSPNTSTNSDSKYSLLVSEAILRQHTIRLDAYRDVISNQQEVDYRLQENNGHIYYYYPLGTSILSIPLVIPFHLLGKSMSIPAYDDAAQNFISAIVLAAIFLVLTQIGYYYLSPIVSLLLVAMCVLGSTLISTLGTALWNQDFAIFCVCVCLWLLVRLENKATFQFLPWLLGLFLFLAYLCRPTTAIFITLALVFILVKHRYFFLPTAFTAFVLLVCFSLFSHYEYGLWLPSYYLPRQLGGLLNYSSQQATPLRLALHGLLFSPSRGLFVYSPIFLSAVLGSILFRHDLKKHALSWLIVLWVVGHVLVVARFPNWWGGFSFGPRLLADILPGLVLLTIFVAQRWLLTADKSSRVLGITLFLLSAGISIIINSYVGMFSQAMLLSHGHDLPPNVDKAPFLLLDWRFPQFVTTPASACKRNSVYIEKVLAEGIASPTDYTIGDEIWGVEAAQTGNILGWNWWSYPSEELDGATATPVSTPFVERQNHSFLPIIFKSGQDFSKPSAVFLGWGLPGLDGAWSTCHTAAVIIGSALTNPMAEELTLTIWAHGHGIQPVTIAINGEVIGQVIFDDLPTAHQLSFSSALLHSNENNRISFHIPNASSMESSSDLRLLGVFLEKFAIDD